MKHLYYLLFTLSIGFAQVPNVWWVDGTSGNDNNNGQSESTAFKTIQTIFKNNYLSAYNDTIYVKEGTYDFKDAKLDVYIGFVIVGVSGAEKTIFDAGSENRHFYLDISVNNKDKGYELWSLNNSELFFCNNLNNKSLNNELKVMMQDRVAL